MNWLQNLLVKWAGVTPTSDRGWEVISGFGSSGLPGSNRDWQSVAGALEQNAVCAAAINWISRTLPESDAVVRREMANGDNEEIRGHPLIALLNTPNPYYTGDQLFGATVSDYLVHGNAYWRKQRTAAGRLAGLWYIPAKRIECVAGDTTDDFIIGYKYRVPSGEQFIPPDDIVHFRCGLNQSTLGRTGVSPWQALAREAAVINAGSNYTASVLDNHGVPGLFLAPKDGAISITEEEARRWKAYLKEATTGDHVGEPVIGMSGSTLTAFGFSPEQLALHTIMARPETLLCAAVGISPMVLGLWSGLERSTYSNYEEAQSAAYEKCVIPMKTTFARTLTQSVLLTEYPRSESLYLTYDYSKVACMQDNADALSTRLVTACGGPYLTANEARVQAGLDELPQPDADVLRSRQPTVPLGGAMGYNNPVRRAFERAVTGGSNGKSRA